MEYITVLVVFYSLSLIPLAINTPAAAANKGGW